MAIHIAGKSDEWNRIANEPATDAEIASYKRHEGCDGSCTPCLATALRQIGNCEECSGALYERERDVEGMTLPIKGAVSPVV